MTLIANPISKDTYDNQLKKCLAYDARLMIPNMKTLMNLHIDQVGDCKEIILGLLLRPQVFTFSII